MDRFILNCSDYKTESHMIKVTKYALQIWLNPNNTASLGSYSKCNLLPYLIITSIVEKILYGNAESHVGGYFGL